MTAESRRPATPARPRHFLEVFDLAREEIEALFQRAAALKRAWRDRRLKPRHQGRVLALVFDKPSLRTSVSFQAAMAHLGGTTVRVGAESGWGTRETVADFARVLGSYVDAVVCRTFAHARLEELARHSPVPVINGLTDWNHPCQALTDLFTLQEHFGTLEGQHLVFLGDGNNVVRSLAAACARLGMRFTLAAPPRYQLPRSFLDRLRAEVPGATLAQTDDPHAAVRDADCIYTDVWASMGQEAEAAERARALAAYRVDGRLMSAAPAHAVFLHCLPAHRGEEVTDEVLDGPQSLAFVQAENRMHLQTGLLDALLEPPRGEGGTAP